MIMYIKMLGDKFRPFCGRGKKYLKLFWDLATFKDYPVDEQVCDIEFESWGHTNDQLIFQWHNVDPIKVNQNISLNQHVFQVGTTTKGGHNYSTGKFYTIFKKSIRDNLTTFPLVLKKFSYWILFQTQEATQVSQFACTWQENWPIIYYEPICHQFCLWW